MLTPALEEDGEGETFFTPPILSLPLSSLSHGPVPADQALRVRRSRPTYMTDAAGLKPRGERESGTSLTGTGYRVR